MENKIVEIISVTFNKERLQIIIEDLIEIQNMESCQDVKITLSEREISLLPICTSKTVVINK